MNKRVIIIGGGVSFEEGITKGAWDKIKGEECWSLNYSHLWMPFLPKREIFVDNSFFKNNTADIIDLHNKGVEVHCRYNKTFGVTLGDWVHQYKITKDRGAFLGDKVFESEKQELFYGGMGLCGNFALSLAIAEKREEIYLCFDKETQVLTFKGWKYFEDLTEFDLILTRKRNGKTEWSNINYKIKMKYKGDMYKFNSPCMDLLVTPKHKFGYLTKSDKFQWVTAEESFHIKKNIKIPITFDFNVGKEQEWFYLPQNPNQFKQIMIKKIKMDYWLAFLGLYLSEGCSSINGGNYKVTIYQNHTREQDDYIQEILNNLPYKYHRHKRGWVFYSKQLVLYLKQFGLSHEKYIPRELMNLSKRQLKILLDALIFGDGRIDNTGYTYWTVSKQLKEDVQEIFYKLGYYCNIYTRTSDEAFKNQKNKFIKKIPKRGFKDCYTIYANNSKKSGSRNIVNLLTLKKNQQIKKIQYDDYVYDVNVKNHIIFVKRNDMCCWSGNCGYDFGSPSCNTKKTHWYQDEVNLKSAEPKKDKTKPTIVSSGVGNPLVYRIKHRDSIKQDLKDFEVYLEKHNSKIWNVSLPSNIPYFDKITWEEFFSKLEN